MEKRIILFPTFGNYEERSEAKKLDFEEIESEVIDFCPIESERRLDNLEDQAYEWFLKKLKDEKQKKYVLNDLNEFFARYGTHYSIFHKEGHKTFLRIYWPEEKQERHVEIDNYERIERNSPSLTRYFVKNGIFSYLEETNPSLCYELFGVKSRKTK